MMLQSCMSWGTSPSSQHWQSSVWRCSRSGSFALLVASAGIPTSPGALPVGRLSIAWLSTSRLSVWSSSSKTGKALHSFHCGIWDGVFPAIKVQEMLHSLLHLLALACDGFTSSRLKWTSLAVCWSDSLLDTVIDTPDVSCVSCQLNTFTELYPVVTGTSSGCVLDFIPSCSKSLQCWLCWLLLVFQQYGMLFLSHSVEFGGICLSNQSWAFPCFLLKTDNAVPWIVSLRRSHLCFMSPSVGFACNWSSRLLASISTFCGSFALLVSIHGFPGSLVWWNFLGWLLICSRPAGHCPFSFMLSISNCPGNKASTGSCVEVTE